MHGLKEAGYIAYQNLVKNLMPFGYEPMQWTPGLWRHKTRHATFTLAVDDFGIKHFTDNYRDHLLNGLKVYYSISIDLTGTSYCCLTIAWNYFQQYVDISMPGYVYKALHKFQHPAPKKPQYAPHTLIPPTYGQQI